VQEERVGGQYHSRCAEAALDCPGVDKCLLQRMEPTVSALQPFNGQHAMSGDILYLFGANAHGLLINQQRACTAGTDVAGILDSRQIEILAEEFNETLCALSLTDGVR
jgi:hypothetical protein